MATMVGGFKQFLFTIIYGYMYIYIWDNPSFPLICIFFKMAKLQHQAVMVGRSLILSPKQKELDQAGGCASAI